MGREKSPVRAPGGPEGLRSPSAERAADRAFFYASDANAGQYDQIVRLVVPQYQLLHDTMAKLLQLTLRRSGRGMSNSPEPPKVILDVGSGTGADSLRLMCQFPGLKVVAVDRSGAMNAAFRNAYGVAFPSSDIDSHVRFVQGDVLGEAGESRHLVEVLADFSRGTAKEFDAVVSALTIHHFESEQKLEVYRRACEVLQSGGLFLNGDLFTYDSAELASAAHEFDIKWLGEHFQEAAEAARVTSAAPLEGPGSANYYLRLGAEWRRHYEEDNRLQSAEAQQEMLRRVGYRHTAVPFRFWQVGVLWAQK